MTTIFHRINWRICLIALASAAVLVGLVLLGRAYDLGKNDWAGWVQAVGSIGAIVGAVWVAAAQNKDARMREQETALAQIKARDESVKLVIDHCFSMIYGLPGARDQYEDYRIHRQATPQRNFVNLQALLASAPLYEVRNPEIVAAAMYMMDLMGNTIALLSFIDSYTPEQRVNGWIQLRSRIQELRRRAWAIKKDLRAAS